MKNIWKWILFGGAVFLLAFCIALPLFRGLPAMPARTIIGYGMMHGGMMDWGWGGTGRFGMLFQPALLILGVAGLAALVYFLAKRPSAPPPPPPVPTVPCAGCEKPLDPGWVACPYCGKKRR
jgi:hypothetical protein